MRRFLGILGLFLALTLTACGGSDDDKGSEDKKASDASTRLATPSGEMTELTVPCAAFADTASKIADAQKDLYTKSGAADAVDKLAGELGELKDGAPADVKRAIDDLVDAFRTAADVLENPTSAGQAELAKLAGKLSEAGQKVTAYVTAKCTKG